MTIEHIRSFVVDRGTIEDLVSLLAFGNLVRAEFESMDIDVPEWLDAKLRTIRKEVQSKHSDTLEQKLANIKLRLKSVEENAKTPQQKIAALRAEAAKMEKALGA